MKRKKQAVAISQMKPKRSKKRPKPGSKHLSEETKAISLPNEVLLKLAERNPPPPEFFEGHVERPW
jgi:hypothetical protein